MNYGTSTQKQTSTP